MLFNGLVIFFFLVDSDLGNTDQNVPKHTVGMPPNQSLDCQCPVMWDGMYGHSRV